MLKSGLIELEVVLAVARLGGFRAAARELGMSSTALSRAIVQLENRLGVRIFNRTTRSVALTEPGKQFIATVGPALSEIQQAMAAVNNHRAMPTGTLRLNCAVGAARAILVPVVLEYLRRFPEMSVDIATEAHFVDIVGRGFDAGIRAADDVPRDMIAVPFGGALKFSVVGSPSYFAQCKKPRTPKDLMSHQCIRARWPSGKLSRWEFERRGEKLSLDVPGNLTLDEPTLMRDAAIAGAGVAYLWEAPVADELATGRLVAVLKDWTVSSASLCLYYPDRRNVSAALRAFIELLREPINHESRGDAIVLRC
ncbi:MULTISPECIES: LysR family transcriptional regulator [Paraburkholderia]|jgi:DNA-binding transcriptional LysR family regulator|uniref:Transcriptional regulator, LysR family n=1 Tax=Paraburkholderia phenazinium TaxID=60549 RepID=A0A1N6JC68_9BURK|nr:LysR family transcriptional regulator [Paraburkholderia phenazinium]SIO41964.1 transcriptional regulator, LysR family [Paraburkholderia phenazinium]